MVVFIFFCTFATKRIAMNYFPFIEETALAAVLYIIRALGGKVDMHRMAKLLYFADQKHLVTYGRTIIGGQYVAMCYGPVPDEIYSILKNMHPYAPYKGFVENIKLKGKYLLSQSAPDLRELSQSDISCLDYSINEYGGLSFEELTNISHNAAWNKAMKTSVLNGRKYIHIEDIAREAGAGDAEIEYIMDKISDHYIFDDVKYSEPHSA